MHSLPTERRATTVVVCGIFFITCREYIFHLEIFTAFVITILCCIAIFLLSFTESAVSTVHRKNAAVGYLCCPLLPVCLLISQGNEGISGSQNENFALGSLILAVFTSAWTTRKEMYSVMWLLAMIAVSIASVIWISTRCAVSQEFVITSAALVVQLCLFQVFQNNLPHSFTVGELTIVTQGISAFLLQSSLLYLAAAKSVMNSELLTSTVETTLFIQTAVVSCSMVVLILFLCDVFHSPVLYYALIIGVAGLFSFPVLTFYFKHDFITWLIRFICRGYDKIFLFVYWTAWCFGLGIITYLNAWRAKNIINMSPQHHSTDFQSSDLLSRQQSSFADEKKVVLITRIKNSVSFSKDDQRLELVKQVDTSSLDAKDVVHGDYVSAASSDSISEANQSSDGLDASSTIVRKQFHIAAVAIFVPGLFYDSQLLYMASTCGVVVLIMIETLRVLSVPPFGTTINECFKVFVDDRDSGKIITTHLYLLIGCSCPLWLYRGVNKPLALYSGLLSLGIGDTCASVIGSRYGLHKWPNTSKSLEGSIASFISQILFAFMIDMSGHVSTFRYSVACLGILLNTLLEAFTSQIDNLVLPLFTYLLIFTAS